MTQDEFQQLLVSAWRMPPGRSQIAAAEELTRRADDSGDPAFAYTARIMAVEAFYNGGEPTKAFVAFTWCLAAYDRGEAVSDHDKQLFWYFKSMVRLMTHFPTVTLAQTDEVLDNMSRRYTRHGFGLGPVHQLRETIARHVGDVTAAEEHYRQAITLPRGEMSDCVGCEPTWRVGHLSWLGRDEEAVETGLPTLAGENRCAEQPGSMLTALLLPFARTGRLENAAEAHRRAYRLIRTTVAELEAVAEHIVFCGLTGNEARGLELIDRHLPWLESAPTPYADMRFRAASALVLKRVVEGGHGGLELSGPSGPVTVAALAEEMTAHAVELAERFDQRNGTSEQSEEIADLLEAEPLCDRLPLSGVLRRATATVPAPPAAPTPEAELPGTAEELVALAERFNFDHNEPAAARAWARFDELCPRPEGLLAAHRAESRAVLTAGDDSVDAMALLRQAEELYERHGAATRADVVRQRMGVFECLSGDSDGLSRVVEAGERIAARGDQVDTARARIRHATALAMSQRLPEAVEVIRAALAEVDPQAHPRAAVELWLRGGQFSAMTDGAGWAAEIVGQAVDVSRELGLAFLLDEALLLRGRLMADQGDLEGGHRVLSEVGVSGDQRYVAEAARWRGRMAMDLGRPADSVQDFLVAVSAAKSLGHEPDAELQTDLANAYLAADQPAEAAEIVEDVLADLGMRLARDQEIGEPDPRLVAEFQRGQFTLARAYRVLGQTDLALSLLGEVAQWCAEQDNHGGLGQMLSLSAEILDELDRDAEAMTANLNAAAAYESAGVVHERIDHVRRAAVSAHWAGEADKAAELLASADELASSTLTGEEPPTEYLRGLILFDGTRILAAQGRLREALVRTQPAVEKFDLLGALPQAAMTRVLRGRLFNDLGEPAKALEALTGAVRIMPAEMSQERAQVEALIAEIRA